MTASWEMMPDIEEEADFETFDDEPEKKWKKIATLGKGATAEVSVWEESGTKEKLAIKVSTRWRVSPKQYNYWKREVDVMNQLRHLNVVRGVVLPDEIRCENPHTILTPLAMEYCNGGSLRQFLRSYGLGVPEGELRNILRDICAGLRYLHRKHIVHRDIKPDNIVIQNDERFIYKITDLGYMKKLDPRNITHSFIGTTGYAAPEVLSSSHCRRYNYLVDYWSLGVTIFEVATGGPPFPGITVSAKKKDAIWASDTLLGIEYMRELPARCQYTLGLRGVLTEWLRTMLQYYPKKRNPDARQTPLDFMVRFIAVTDKKSRTPGGDKLDVQEEHGSRMDSIEEETNEAGNKAKGKEYKTF